jgi:hypothetical protein
MPVVTVRVDEEVKRKMEELREVNWSEVTRAAIEEKIREVELWKPIDNEALRKASQTTDALRRKVEGWDSAAEIRRWRSNAGKKGSRSGGD